MNGDSPEFSYLRQLVYQHSAIVLEANQFYLAESRLGEIAQHAGYGSTEKLLAQLRQEKFHGLHRKVVEAMTTNETSFFRDIHPFEALRKVVLPTLVKMRLIDRRLTIWCAAASSGQEPFSLAMLLREHFPEIVTNWTVRIIATDLSGDILQKAKAGRYTQFEVGRGLPAQLMVKYFRQEGKSWCVNDTIMKMIEFREMNLAQPWPLLPLCDLVMMRNVLIYFDLNTKRDILRRVRELLKPGGALFLGTAETTLNLDATYLQKHVEKTTYFTVGSGA